MCTPVFTAKVERSFSTMDRIINIIQKYTGPKTLYYSMKISIEVPIER